MLMNQTLDKLDALGLFGMALGLREQLECNQYLSLSFDERLGLLVDREAEARDSRRSGAAAQGGQAAPGGHRGRLDFRAPAVSIARCLSLAQAGWVAAHHNLLITGPTGAGKSFRGLRVDACRGPPWPHRAVRAHAAAVGGVWRSAAATAATCAVLAQLAKIGVLVLDDFLLTPPSVIEAKDLLEVIDDRSQVRSTLVVSQLPVEAWHPALDRR